MYRILNVFILFYLYINYFYRICFIIYTILFLFHDLLDNIYILNSHYICKLYIYVSRETLTDYLICYKIISREIIYILYI